MFWIYLALLQNRIDTTEPNNNNGFYSPLIYITQRSVFQSVSIHAIKLLFEFPLTINMEIQLARNTKHIQASKQTRQKLRMYKVSDVVAFCNVNFIEYVKS